MPLTLVQDGHIALAEAMYQKEFCLAWGDLGENYGEVWGVEDEVPNYVLKSYTEELSKGAINGEDALTKRPVFSVTSLTELSAIEEVDNGEFTYSTEDWYATNAEIESVIGGVTGNCLKILQENPNSESFVYQQLANLDIGKKYLLTFYAKVGTAPVGKTLSFGFGTSSSNLIIASSLDNALTEEYKKFSLVATVTVSNPYITFVLPSSVGGSVLIDKVSVRKIIEYSSPADYILDADRGVINWSPNGNEPNPGSTYTVVYIYKEPIDEQKSLIRELGRRKASQKCYAIPDPNGTIQTVDGQLWRLIDPNTEPNTKTRFLYLKFQFDGGDGQDNTIYQVGLFTNTVFKSGLPQGQMYFLPSDIVDPGILFMIGNISPIARNPYTRELREYIIIF